MAEAQSDERPVRWVRPVVALAIVGVVAFMLRPRREDAADPSVSTDPPRVHVEHATAAAGGSGQVGRDAAREDTDRRAAGTGTETVEVGSAVELRSDQAREAAKNRRELIAKSIASLEAAAIQAESDGHPERAAQLRRRMQLLKQRAEAE